MMKSVLIFGLSILLLTPSLKAQSAATQVERINAPDGFKVELLYSVPKEKFGSWVAMTIDDKGRFIVSDQYGALYRFPAPAPGKTLSEDQIEKIPVDIGGAQGLLYAFDSLYVVLNTKEHGGRGLYRISDSDGDDQFDKKVLLRKFEEKGGEHGPHAVIKGPDGESLYIIIGNQTSLTEIDESRVPRLWDEDLILERPYGRGFMKGTPAPGGWIAKTDPEGKKWELIATGFRNEYDAAFNREGELFTYDADMEWDVNTPWYRPTRINHVVSGAEFGWRNGGGKWPEYYPDSVGAVVNVGPGSPTGVAFGYGTKFPKKYQDAFYAADWSYGKLYAIHMEPDGASYTGTIEEFVSAQPLPLTDIEVNPKDGAMYFTVGGRRVQSGLYRVTYVGDEKPGDEAKTPLTEKAKIRRKLEEIHRTKTGDESFAWENLGHEDRAIRFAARVALEHLPVDSWKDKLMAEKDPDRVIQAVIALSRIGEGTVADKRLEGLTELDWKKLTQRQRIDLTRAAAVNLARHGDSIHAKLKEKFSNYLSPQFPVGSPSLNAELLQLLVYLGDPSATEKGIELLEKAPSQEEQMAYAKSLRHQKVGWDRDLRSRFYEWFAKASGYKGGASFSKFVENMKQTALENTPDAEKEALAEVINKLPVQTPLYTPEARSFVKNWAVADFDDVIAVGLEGNRDFENGRKMFGQATCYVCHRFKMEGGALGPDLTSVSGKFSPRDLLEQIIEPSKEISDQYGQMIFTKKDGSQVFGRIMNLANDDYRITTDMMDPSKITTIKTGDIKDISPSPISMMPPGLINTLSKDDVLDLLAYMLSKGDAEDPMFQE